MSEIRVFDNGGFGEVRGTMVNGEVYLVGKDISDKLEYRNGSRDINRHVDEDDRLILPIHDGLQNRNTIFINESGLYALVLSSTLPKARAFRKWVTSEVLPQIKNEGSYNAIEQNLKLIQDDKERELSLGLYSIEKALESNQNDLTLSILYNQKKTELDSYKHTIRLNDIETEVKQIGDKFNKFIMIGDRMQFKREVDSICRASGLCQAEVFGITYNKFKDMYGVDLQARVRNMRKELQKARVITGKKEYAESTLKTKINSLDVVEDLEMWMEMSKCLGTVRIEVIQ